jgi:hypothetical protein
MVMITVMITVMAATGRPERDPQRQVTGGWVGSPQMGSITG